MSVHVQEVRGGKRGTATLTEETQFRRFRVLLSELTSHSASDAMQAVLMYLGFSYGHTPTYPTRPDLFLFEVSISQVEEESVFLVDVKYSANVVDAEVSPIFLPCSIEWSYKPFSEVLAEDLETGRPITSSAGEIFVPPFEEPVYHPCCTIVRNEEFFDPAYAYSYQNKVNADYFQLAGYNIDPGYALMRNVRGVRKVWRGDFYAEVTYEIELNPETWTTYLLDQGTFYLDNTNTKKLFKIEGEPADRPMNLDGSGHPLADGIPPVYLPYITKGRAAFGPLLLPISMDDPGYL